MQDDSILSLSFKCTNLLMSWFYFHRKLFSVLGLQWQQQRWHLFWQQIPSLQQPRLVSVHNATVGGWRGLGLLLLFVGFPPWGWSLFSSVEFFVYGRGCIWKCMSRLQERNNRVLQGGGLAWDFCPLYLDVDTLVWYGSIERSCAFFSLGSVSHTQAPTSTIVTMTMPSHSSHATAVTTSNIPVGEWFQFQEEYVTDASVFLFMLAVFVHVSKLRRGRISVWAGRNQLTGLLWHHFF